MPIIKVQESMAPQIAASLLKIEAIKLNINKPFIWSSGWKSPIYCDNRISLSYPEIRNEIKKGLELAVKENFYSAECIAGVATAGIPQGALLADALDLPFVYVRSKPKDHGMENLIEGRVLKGQKAVVVEDLISTGGSSLKAVQALRDQGVEVIGMVSIFSYGFDIARKNFYDADMSLISLSDYDHLIRFALEQQYVTSEELKLLRAWRDDPSHWKNK